MKVGEFELIFYNKEYKEIKDELVSGKSSSRFINKIDSRLNIKEDGNFFNHGYLVKLNDCVVGYLYVSGISNSNIYLEYSILLDFRGQKIARRLVSSVTNYICENYNINEIRLNIYKDNGASQRVAEECGYFLEDEEEYLYKGDSDFVINNPYFINKRRN